MWSIVKGQRTVALFGLFVNDFTVFSPPLTPSVAPPLSLYVRPCLLYFTYDAIY